MLSNSSSLRISINAGQKDYSNLIQQKLKNPNKEISFDDSIGLLLQCIKLGDKQAQKAKNKDIVLFIGNTGAGKSTTINFLYGCKMVKKSPKEIGVDGLEDLVIVLPKKDGGTFDEVMKIGHSKLSQTFIPEVEYDKKNDLTYVDCPGFLDNRGSEINIANAVNIKNTLKQSKSAKVIILINYNSLNADRGRGTRELLLISSHLFGSDSNLIKNKMSILIAVANCPDNIELDRLKTWIFNGEQESTKSLSETVIVFNPVKSGIIGRCNLNEMISKIKSLKPIHSPDKLFKTALGKEDEGKLKEWSESINEKIDFQFENKNISENNFLQAATQLFYLKQLSVIEHATVERLYLKSQIKMERKLKDLSFECCTLASIYSFDESDQAFSLLEKSIQYFDEDIQSNFNIHRIREQIATCKKRKAKQEVENERSKEKLKKAENKIEELCRLLQDQKSDMKSQLAATKIAFEKIEKDQKINLENALNEFDRYLKKLEDEIELNLKNKEEELKEAKRNNKTDLQLKIEEEKKRLLSELEIQSNKIKKEKNDYERKQKSEWEKIEKKQKEEHKKLENEIKKLEEEELKNNMKIRELNSDQNGDSYQGSRSLNGEKNGNGICYYANQDFYNGEYQNDKREGIGRMVYANKDIYDGQWQNDKQNGKGQCVFANRDIYNGEWKNNKMEGKGICRFANRSVYEGEWRNGRREGKGTCRYANGDFYDGEWKNDKRDGRGECIFANNEFFNGMWENDNMKKNCWSCY